jgi:nitrogen fixation protein NifQ
LDAHVVAAVLSLASAEVGDRDGALAECAGLDGEVLAEIRRIMFPGAELGRVARGARLERDAEEQSVRDLLMMYASGSSWLERPLASIIARRCRQPNHLWQDLGLRSRGELSDLMRRHFGPMARKNSGDMKWKKFLYRMICSAEGFTLCTTPVCSECTDFEVCFGAEDGEARLARQRRSDGLAA